MSQSIEFQIQQIREARKLANLQHIFHKVFETDADTIADSETLNQLIHSSTFYALGAFLHDTLIGGLSAYEMTLITGQKEWYIYNIVVLEEHRGKGAGKMLMEHFINYAKSNGAVTVFVEAEEEDEGAVQFYRKLPEAQEVAVRHFNFSTKS